MLTDNHHYSARLRGVTAKTSPTTGRHQSPTSSQPASPAVGETPSSPWTSTASHTPLSPLSSSSNNSSSNNQATFSHPHYNNAASFRVPSHPNLSNFGSSSSHSVNRANNDGYNYTMEDQRSGDEVISSYRISRPIPLWLNASYSKQIVRGNFMTLSARPKTVEEAEWIAHQGVYS